MTAVPGAKDPAGRGKDMLRGREREREGEPDGAATGEGAGVPDGTAVRPEAADGATETGSDGVAAAGETEPAGRASGRTGREAGAESAGSTGAARDAAPDAGEGDRDEEAGTGPETPVEAEVPPGDRAEDGAAEPAGAAAGGDGGGAALPESGADDDRGAGSAADAEAEPRVTAEDHDGGERAAAEPRDVAAGDDREAEGAEGDGTEPASAPVTDRRSDSGDEGEALRQTAEDDAPATAQPSGAGKDDVDEARPEDAAGDAPAADRPSDTDERVEDGARPDTSAGDAAAAGQPSGAGTDESDGARPEAPERDTQAADRASDTDVHDGDGARPEASESHTPAADLVSDTNEDDADGARPGTTKGDAPGADGAGQASDGGAARVPAWARGDDESDNERTSTFVPLKPLEPREAGEPRAGKAPEGPEPGRGGGDQRTVHLRTPTPPEGEDPKPEAGHAQAQPKAPRPKGSQAVPAEPAPTTEQPLPPLDLLAQLTNTPPPPETTTRTLVRRVKVWTPVVLLLAGVFAGVQALRPVPAATLTTDGAASSATVDGRLDLPWPAAGQGAVRVQGAGDVGTFGMQKPVPTASVAKVMTAYVILRDHPLKKNEDGPRIEVDAQAVQDGTAEHESRIEGLTAGSTFSQQDMLKMLMIPSGNNVARLLARWDGGGDQGAFVAKMNAAAKELGMTSTRYTDPSGLDPKTVSTATDQLKLAEAVMKFDAFRAIVALPNARIEGLPEPINNNNDNLLLSGLSIKGIKTGSSSAAGGALMWAAYKTVGDKTPLIIGTLMDQHVDGPDPDAIRSLGLVKDNSKKIIEAVRNALTAATAVKKGQVVGYVDDHLGTRTPLVATQDVTAVAVPGQKLSLALTGSGDGKLPAEAPAGTVVATLTVGTGPGAPTVPVAVQHDLEAPSFGAKLTRLG
ncbi:serine hydrolase [Streptomyces sp. NPDC101118]|uniref:serine hydrolase n=1 Tax=Streptomyces sp. NPDC101118 TaxID=3366109 RepID=UPI0038174E98